MTSKDEKNGIHAVSIMKMRLSSLWLAKIRLHQNQKRLKNQREKVGQKQEKRATKRN